MTLYQAIKDLENRHGEEQAEGMISVYEHGVDRLREDLQRKENEVKSANTTIKYMRHALKERGVSDHEMDYIFQGIYYRMSENKKN